MSGKHLIAVGGSDAGIAAALRARALDPGWDVTVVVADAFPNFSICGIPYYLSGEVGRWQNLAHRTAADLEATGMALRLNTLATDIDVTGRGLIVQNPGAITVDEQMRTTLPGVFAAGDCVVTHHRLLGQVWLPLGTTAHKQGRVAGENAVGGHREFAGSLGTQVVKVFDLVAARTGLRDQEARSAGHGWEPVTATTTTDDHKAYYPGATPITLSVTGDHTGGRLLGTQLIGRLGAEISQRVDTYAAALFNEMTVDQVSDLDLSYTPPLGSPWDAVQIAGQAWTATREAATPVPLQNTH